MLSTCTSKGARHVSFEHNEFNDNARWNSVKGYTRRYRCHLFSRTNKNLNTYFEYKDEEESDINKIINELARIFTANLETVKFKFKIN